MQIKKITFVLEDCEVIEFDGKYIGEFGVGKIKERFERLAINSIDAWKECGEFWIEIHKDGNIPQDQFHCGNNIIPFDRLIDYDDICDIEIECVDQEHGSVTYKYSVRWRGSSEYSNESQDSLIGQNGNLYLKIGKKQISEYFLDTSNTRWPWIYEEDI